jgi:hypothetical protein
MDEGMKRESRPYERNNVGQKSNVVVSAKFRPFPTL